MRKLQPISRIGAGMTTVLMVCVGMLVLPAVVQAIDWSPAKVQFLFSLNAQSGGDALNTALYSGCSRNDPVFIHHSCGSTGTGNQEAGDGTGFEMGILLPLDEGLPLGDGRELELAGGVLSERFGGILYDRPSARGEFSQRFDSRIPFSLSSANQYFLEGYLALAFLSLLPIFLPISVYDDLFGSDEYTAKMRRYQFRAQLFAHLNESMRWGVGGVVHLNGRYKQAAAKVSQTIKPALGIRLQVDWRFRDYDIRYGLYLQHMAYDIEGLVLKQRAGSIGFTTGFYFD